MTAKTAKTAKDIDFMRLAALPISKFIGKRRQNLPFFIASLNTVPRTRLLSDIFPAGNLILHYVMQPVCLLACNKGVLHF